MAAIGFTNTLATLQLQKKSFCWAEKGADNQACVLCKFTSCLLAILAIQHIHITYIIYIIVNSVLGLIHVQLYKLQLWMSVTYFFKFWNII